jgi:hypothetical protein
MHYSSTERLSGSHHRPSCWLDGRLLYWAYSSPSLCRVHLNRHTLFTWHHPASCLFHLLFLSVWLSVCVCESVSPSAQTPPLEHYEITQSLKKNTDQMNKMSSNIKDNGEIIIKPMIYKAYVIRNNIFKSYLHVKHPPIVESRSQLLVRQWCLV